MVVFGVDPGAQGGISVIKEGKLIAVYPMPTKKVPMRSKKGKFKTQIDEQETATIFQRHIEPDSILALEEVHAGPSQGAVSMFSFGDAFGTVKGVGAGVGCKVLLIRPQEWKTSYSQLETEDVKTYRMNQKILRLEAKNTKDKALKKEKNKEVKRLGTLIKRAAKDAARLLAMELFQDYANECKLKKHDGKAEAVLIGLHVQEHLNELV